jgi:hypothetical protein
MKTEWRSPWLVPAHSSSAKTAPPVAARREHGMPLLFLSSLRNKPCTLKQEKPED